MSIRSGLSARRIGAALVAPLLVASTALVAVTLAASPATAFGPTAVNLNCWVQDISSAIAPWNGASHQLELSGGASVGSNASITYTYSAGPPNGGPKAAQVVKAVFEVTQGGATQMVTSNTVDLGEVPAGGNSAGATLTATAPITASGPFTVKVHNIVFTATLFALDVACNSQSTGTKTTNPLNTPVTTPIAETVTIGGGTGTPTATATPTPTPTTATPTPTTSSPTPTSTPTTTSSPTPTPTGSSASPTPTPTTTGVSGSLACTTLGQTKPWSTSFSASLTGSKLNVKFAPGPDNGPVAIQANWMKATAKVKAPGDVSLEAVPYGAILAREPIPGTTMSGAVTGSPTSITLTDVVFDDFGSGSDVDTTCVPSATITVPVASSPELPDTLPTSTGDLDVNPDTVTAGGTVTFSGGGFAPGSNATAGMYSTPVALGVGTADSAGDITVDVTIPSGTTGSHTLILYGVDTSGGVVALTKTVTVTAATSTPTPTGTSTTDPTDDPDPDNDGGLPKTGPEDMGMTLLWAAVALQIGLIAAVRASRSRGASATAGKHRR